jgi:hypothetical protein
VDNLREASRRLVRYDHHAAIVRPPTDFFVGGTSSGTSTGTSGGTSLVDPAAHELARSGPRSPLRCPLLERGR